MKRKILAAALAATFAPAAFAAAGASSSSSNNVDVVQDHQTTTERNLSVEKKGEVSKSIPLLAVLQIAASELMDEENCVGNSNTNICMLLGPFSLVSEPIEGWHHDIFDKEGLAKEARELAFHATLVNEISAILAKRLTKHSYKSFTAAIKASKKGFKWLARPKNFDDFLLTHKKKIAVPNSDERLVLDLAHSQKPVSFYLKNAHFEGDGNGVSFQKYGLLWFGGNTINGEEMKLAINASKAASANRKSSVSGNAKVTTGSKTEGKVGTD